MDRFAVMVDAGYLLRQAIEIVSHKASTKRQHLEITDPAGLVVTLIERVRSTLNLGQRELLRVYWYDGVMPSGLTHQQRALIDLPDFNFRAGTVNSVGQQKGVDSLIVTDLLELASNHAISDAALITGDSDLAVGIDLAQKKGVRIAVIGIEDLSVGVSHKQSFEVTSRADRVARLGGSELNAVMRYVAPAPIENKPQIAVALEADTKPHPEPSAQPAPVPALDNLAIEAAVKAFIESQASLSKAIDPSTKRIDAVVDKALIHHVYADLNHGKLSIAEKNFARDCFRSEMGLG